MIKTKKHTNIWIDQVESIQVIKPEKKDHHSESGIYDESDAACTIMITCANGESLHLFLTGRYPENLVLREFDKNWIIPKPYKGSKEEA
jgi:hypothetical protein